MASKPDQFVLHVIFEDREDGGLRARCPEVPNFYLSHSDRELVLKDVEPALSTILSGSCNTYPENLLHFSVLLTFALVQKPA